MTHEEINNKMSVLVKTERKITREILELICLAERQRTPLALGYKDTYDWLIKFHGYSGSAANRRVQAAQLLKEVPEVAGKLEAGDVNLTTLCQAQTTARSQQAATGEKVTSEQKRKAVESIDHKTSNEAQRSLLELFPQAEKSGEKTTSKRNGGSSMIVELTAEEAQELQRARELLSHTLPHATNGNLIGRLAREFNNRHDPLRKKPAKSSTRSSTVTVLQRNTTQTRRELIQKAGGKCSYVDPLSGRKCESTYQLEIDHIIPKAKGGTDDVSNLRCLCRRHNQYMAEFELGYTFMQEKRTETQRTNSPAWFRLF